MFTVGAMYRYIPTGAACRIDKNDGNRQRVRITIVDPASAANGQELDEVPYHALQDLPHLPLVTESPTPAAPAIEGIPSSEAFGTPAIHEPPPKDSRAPKA